MKQLICIVTVALLITACGNKNQCVVKGSLKGIENTKGILQYVNQQGRMDTIKVTGNNFIVNAKVTQPQLALLAFQQIVDSKDTLQMMLAQQKNPISFAVFLEPGKTITIEGDANKPDNIKFSGSKLNNEFLDFQSKTLKPVLQKEQAFIQMAQAVAAKNPGAMDSLNNLYLKITEEKKNLIVQNNLKNKNSIVAATYTFLIYQALPVDSSLKEVYKNLSSDVKKSFAGLRIKEKIDQDKSIASAAKAIKVGDVVPNFTLKNVAGKEVTLSDLYKGKKLFLIDFWASWCKPCRNENPNVVKAYNSFKSKGFEILGVSIDEEKDAWLQAIKSDGLKWEQVIDAAGWSSKTAQLYGVEAIPASFLIDGNGKLIAQDLRGEELMAKLAAVLK
jgi:peroxiredoxin